jgi:hypothetical protein
VSVHDSRIYVAEGADGLEMFDPADLSVPVGSFALAPALDVTILESGASTFALIANGDGGLCILDVTDPTAPLPAPVVVSTMDTGGDVPVSFSAVSVSTWGDMAFVGLGSDGILVLDLTNPAAPVQLAYRNTAGVTTDIVPRLVDERVYLTLADQSSGMQVFYIYDSSATTDDTKPLVPTIDSGCFIGSTDFSITPFIKRLRRYF